MMKTVLITLSIVCSGYPAFAQFDTIKPPIERQLRHDKINEEQKLLDKADGKLDGLVKVSANEEIALAVTDALIRRIDQLQANIERNKKIAANNEKVRYLIYTETLLRNFRTDWRARKINPLYAPQLVDNFEKILLATIDTVNMAPLIEAMPYEIAKINADIFTNNIGYRDAKNVVYLKFCQLNPGKILANMQPFVDEKYADSLLKAVAKNDPGQLYKYAQDVFSPVGKLIHNSSNNLIKTIVQVSNTPGAMLLFPFIDDIVSGKKNIDSLKK